MHLRLQKLDEVIAARLHPNDAQRIQRALEVIAITGRPLSELQAEHRQQEQEKFPYRVLRQVVCPDSRAVLHERINYRFKLMIQQGFLDEVRTLMSRDDLSAALPAMRCVGYRQAWSYLQGELSEQDMVLKAQAATRQLAKRQLTWLRQETEALWYDLQWEEVQKKQLQDLIRFLEI
jgi:tRNA dimethylallyltransferase